MPNQTKFNQKGKVGIIVINLVVDTILGLKPGNLQELLLVVPDQPLHQAPELEPVRDSVAVDQKKVMPLVPHTTLIVKL